MCTKSPSPPKRIGHFAGQSERWIAQKPVVANLHKPLWQNVHQDATNKLYGWQRHNLLSIAIPVITRHGNVAVPFLQDRIRRLEIATRCV